MRPCDSSGNSERLYGRYELSRVLTSSAHDAGAPHVLQGLSGSPGVEELGVADIVCIC